jgi:Na+/glutamate symporter
MQIAPTIPGAANVAAEPPKIRAAAITIVTSIVIVVFISCLLLLYVIAVAWLLSNYDAIVRSVGSRLYLCGIASS